MCHPVPTPIKSMSVVSIFSSLSMNVNRLVPQNIKLILQLLTLTILVALISGPGVANREKREDSLWELAGCLNTNISRSF